VWRRFAGPGPVYTQRSRHRPMKTAPVAPACCSGLGFSVCWPDRSSGKDGWNPNQPSLEETQRMEAMSSLMASRLPTDRDGPLLNAAAATACSNPLDPDGPPPLGVGPDFGDSFALNHQLRHSSPAVLLQHGVSTNQCRIPPPVIWVDTATCGGNLPLCS